MKAAPAARAPPFAVSTTPRDFCSAVLFLSATSPGAVLRFLERRLRPLHAAAASPPSALLLSDAVGPEQIRLLAAAEGGDTAAPDWLREQAAPLSGALDTRVTLLVLPRSGEPAWNFVVWEGGAEIERGGGTRESERRPTLWERLPGARRPPLPEAVWARERGLPLDRLTAPVVDYVTVAQLDQRGLLVEDRPRLYRFPLRAA